MTRYDQLLADTQDEYDHSIKQNPIFAVVTSGKMTRNHYITYLKETYHLVKHTSRALAQVGARLPDHRRELRTWFFTQSLDENNHDLFCVNDLRALGEDPDRILADGMMMPGAWGMVTQIYYMAGYGNPAATLGVATATEGLGADLATHFATVIERTYGIPADATTFLRSHGISDESHIEEARRAVNTMVEDEAEYRQIVFARKMTLKYYGRLFEDVLSVDPVDASASKSVEPMAMSA
jgi:pyrroloquinoline quinone (PQQ) biosynthesis protein C